MVEIVISIASKVAEYLVAPVGRQLGYLFHYNSNMAELRNEVEKLGEARESLQLRVGEAIRHGDEMLPNVRNWLRRANDISQEAQKFIEDEKKARKSCFNRLLPNLISRYQLSREAKKKAEEVKKRQGGGDFQIISYRAPLPGAGSAPLKGYEALASRVPILDKIMEALRGDDVDMIGVWGMGGVGKTTLVKQVAIQAKQENLFATEVYIDLSWTRHPEKLEEGIAKIQQQTAEMLGFQFQGKNETTRADELKQRLKKEKILIILDDIWKEVDLEKVGIPSKDDQTKCKILLASRNEDIVRKDMGAKQCFPIQHLQEEEAWHLFKKTAGDSVEGDQLRPIAIQVVNECQGLPIAIVTIAKALKEESVAVWKNALDELRSSAPINIRGVEEKVYTCLEWSYNHLKGDEVKSLFLLCGSLSYGDISMDDLLRYAMGLDLFDHIKSLEQARNKLVTLVRTLKASSLLLDGEDHRHEFGGASRLLFMDADNQSVRMHDIVRDVARNISSKDAHRFVVIEDVPLEEWPETNESEFFPLNCEAVLELPQGLVRPELRFFLLHNDNPSLIIPDTFFEGMNQLKVLDVSTNMHFAKLPPSLQSVANLRTLLLHRCWLGDIALIGELKKLQVLSLVGSSIQQLPSEMGQLTNLRLLDLNNCKHLTVIPQNILSSLSRLECLFMKSSFTQWAAEEVSDTESNACLLELNHLRHLTTIEIEVPVVRLLPKEDMFFENLTSYAIFIGNFFRLGINYRTSRTLKLKEVDGSLLLRDGIGKLLKKTEELELRELEEACRGPIPLWSLNNLKTLDVGECHGLKFLFSLSTTRSLSQLEEMTIQHCNVMQQIIAYERESEIQEDDHVGNNLQLYPKLRSLKLKYLPMLMNFDYFGFELETTSQGMCSQGNLDIDMPFFSCQVPFLSLEKLELNYFLKMKEIWHHQLPFGSFHNLQILSVYKCPCLLNLFPSHLIQSFHNLKKIEVDDCKVLENVFTFDLQGLDRSVGILPKLETLKLGGLPRLRYITCNENKNNSMRCLFSSPTLMDFQNLKCLSIIDCANEDKVEGHADTPMEDVVLFNEKVSFPNLEKLELKGLLKLKEIWHHQLPPKFFYNLWILSVYNCPCLVNLVPPHLIQSFQNLKEINVQHCEVLEHVFDLRGLNGDIEILPKLEILNLEAVPRLKHIICNEDKRCLFFPSTSKDFYSLKEVHVIRYRKQGRGGLITSFEDAILNEKASFLDEVSNYEAFQSRASTFNKIMDALRDDDINLIGVWGKGGVGKTTLLKQVAQQAKQHHLFTTLVYVDVSWTRESDKLQQGIARIQQQIAEMLGFQFHWKDKISRKEELNQRLKKRKKLIILDDIWNEVDLGEVGIPSKGDGTQCKIVLTSRDRDLLCEDMGAQVCFPVEHLPPEEAWSLFKQATGDSVEENLELRPIAIQVAEECEGLPIAIVTIAKALKDETVAVWKNALEQLRSCALTNIIGVDEKVYSCLGWTYNHLKGDEVKSLFLLCGSLTYDDISMDHLLQYGMGLDLFDHIDSLEQARNRLLAWVEILKASGLLLDSHEDRHNSDEERASSLLFMDADTKFVRMHSVVREVARAIAFKDPHPFVVREDVGFAEWSETDESERCTFTSLNCKAVLEFPQGLVCPELQFFLLHNDNPSLNIPNTFFEVMKKLKVLDLSYMHFTTLPSSLDSLANLRTLRLDWCKLVDIALIGKLVKLEVLSLVGSTIQQLPNEMVQLTNLRLLDLNDCKELKVIPRNILSRLSRLECLYIESSFTQWTVEGASNACLSELNHLSHLTTLNISIPDAKLLPKDMLFQNLTRYKVFVGNFYWFQEHHRTKRVLKFQRVNISLCLRDGIRKLLERSEELVFNDLRGTKCVLCPSNKESFLELKHLLVRDSPKIQYIIDSKDQQFLQHGAFPLLEFLDLERLNNLKEVWHGPIPIGSFANLRTLIVCSCPKLKYLFLLPMARGFFQLEAMQIGSCKAMQQIIAFERESDIKEDEYVGTNSQLFPNLRSLQLWELPQLINFSSEVETTTSTSLSTNAISEGSFFNQQVLFPNLEELRLTDLPKLKDIWHYQLPFGSFGNLQILKVYHCSRLLNLIPSSSVQSFQNLKKVSVTYCEVLEHVIVLQGIDENVDILPKLETLKLEYLPRLRWTEDGNDSKRYISSPLILMNIQNLKKLRITNCRMEDSSKM